MGDNAATVLAQLCTYNGRLPQGAPTSPVISNLVSTNLDRSLVKIAKRYHLRYSRYADDITFSSTKNIDEDIIKKAVSEDGSAKFIVGPVLFDSIKKSGFYLNEGKNRLQHRSQRQVVTGLIVNKGVNVNRKYIKKTRAMINSWNKNLIEAERRYCLEREFNSQVQHSS